MNRLLSQVIAAGAVCVALALPAHSSAQSYRIKSISIASNTPIGGEEVTLYINLWEPAPSGGALITVWDEIPSLQTPSQVTVPAGQTSHQVKMSSEFVTANQFGLVWGSDGHNTVYTGGTVHGGFKDFTITPGTVIGGSPATCTVTIWDQPGQYGRRLYPTDNSGAIQTPEWVHIAAGTTSLDFTVQTSPVGLTATRQIYLTYGTVTKCVNLTMVPGLNSVSVNPNTVLGGLNVTGMISLLGPAPAGGVSVAVSDNTSVIVTPSSVTVPEGATFQAFTVVTLPVVTTVTRQIFADLAGTTRAANLTVSAAL